MGQDPVDRGDPYVVEKWFAPFESLVRGCHRRQANVDTRDSACGNQAVGDIIGGLGLASPRHVLDDNENWTIAGLPRIEKSLAGHL